MAVCVAGIVLLLTALCSASSELKQLESASAKKASLVEFASPLQTLTLYPPSTTTTNPREEYLEKNIRKGLRAEVSALQSLAEERKRNLLSYDNNNDDDEEEWDKKIERQKEQRQLKEESVLEAVFDRAIVVSPMKKQKKTTRKENVDDSGFQFVGVVNKNGPVTWYATKKKRTNRREWNVRLVHADRTAILRDLFVRGKIDIFAHYRRRPNDSDEKVEMGEKIVPVESVYTVKERSWRNLWNVSPKHWFTDSSGAYWRERRVSPGLYTDGRTVYESTYRYADGTNGMKPVSTLTAFLKSPGIKESVKRDIVQRLYGNSGKNDGSSPDVVLEE